MNKIYLVKLGFRRLAPAKKVTKTNSIIGSITGNPVYVTPSPSMPEMQAAADALNDALANLNGDPENTAIKDAAEAALNEKMTLLVSYVQTTSGGDNIKILSSGMDVRTAPTKAELLGPVTGLTAALGKNPGEVILKWKGIKGSRLNIVGVSTDNVHFTESHETTKSKITISGLVSGTVYYFRIAVINTAGTGPWSEVISIKAY